MESSSPTVEQVVEYVDKYNRNINGQMRVGGGTSGRHQKVSDPALDVLLPALNFPSLNTLLLMLQGLL